MPNDALDTVAKFYRLETGFDAQRYRDAVKAGAKEQGRANALLGDLAWYHRHTEDIHRRLRRAINSAL